MYRKAKIIAWMLLTLAVGLAGLWVLMAHVNEVLPSFTQKQCVGGFVWDSKQGYTGEVCQVGFKG